ncbi:MAG: hypothetical protein Q4F76_03810 [Lachnospiraceae bacterium]|nr:hypothetical protein [Lachnospiraceae bacterium]
MKPKHEPEAHAGRSSHQTRRPKKRSGWMDVLLFYLLPFIVVNGILFILVASKPHITIQVADTRDYRTTTAAVTVTSLLPIREFTSSQEGSPLEMTEGKKGRYTATITRNGVIEIYAKSLNGMTDIQYEHVNILDDVAPLVGDQYSIQDGILTLTLDDSQSGLDWTSVYGVTASGLSIAPVSVDKQTGTFTFEMDEESLIIYASDLAGNPMQATFSTHMELLNPDGTPAASAVSEAEEAADINGQTLSDETEGSAEEHSEAVPESETTTAAAAQANGTNAADAASSQTPDPSESSGSSGEVSIYINTTTP